MRVRPESFAFTIFLSALGAILPLSIDMSLPALTQIAAGLHCSDAEAGLTLSVFMFGLSVAPLVFGPLSDRFGRKLTLLWGVGLFSLSAAVCTFAPNIRVLLWARLFQGFGAGDGMVLTFAIIRDLFEGTESRKRLSYISVIMTLAPAIAPTLGSALLAAGGWRLIYGALAFSGLLVCLGTIYGLAESLPPERRCSLEPRVVARNYKRVLTHRISAGYSVLNAFAFGGLFAYISISPLYLMQVLHVPLKLYAAIFALTSFGIILGAFINSRLLEMRVRPGKPLLVGLTLHLVACITLLAIDLMGCARISTMLPFIFMLTFSMGLITPNASHGAMHPLPEIAGAAAAVLSSIRMIFGSIASAVVAYVYSGHSAIGMAAVMIVCSAAAWLGYQKWIPARERNAPAEAEDASLADVMPME